MSDSTTALSQPTLRTPRVNHLEMLSTFRFAGSTYFERSLPLGFIKGIDENAETKLRIILAGIEAIASRPDTSIGRIVRVELTLDRRGGFQRSPIGALLYTNKQQEPVMYVAAASFGSHDFTGTPIVDGTHLCYTLLETLGIKRAMIDEVNALVKNSSYTLVFSREPFMEVRGGEMVISPHRGPNATWEYWLADE